MWVFGELYTYLFTIMMPVQPCASIFVTQVQQDAGGWHACPSQVTGRKEANRASGAYNAEEPKTWADQGLHLREQTYIITSEVKTW